MDHVLEIVKAGVALAVTALVIAAVMKFYNVGENLVTKAANEGFGVEEIERAPLTMYNNKSVKGEDVLQCCRQYSDHYEIRVQTFAMQNAADASGVTKDYFVYGDFSPTEQSDDPEHKKVPTASVSLREGSTFDTFIKADMDGDGVVQEYDINCYVDKDPTKGTVPLTKEHAQHDHAGQNLTDEQAIAAGHKPAAIDSEVSVVNPYWINPDGDFFAYTTKDNGEYVITFRQELN